MRGLNKVVVSGDVTGRIEYGQTPTGVKACSFWIESDRRHVGAKRQASAFSTSVKVNAYGAPFVDVLRRKLREGRHVLVDGELMNRVKKGSVEMEVRALEIIFHQAPKEGDRP